MNEDNKRLIESLILKGKTYQEIGEALNVTKQRAYQLCQSLELKTRRPKTITGTLLREKLKTRKSDPLERARNIIRKLRKEDPQRFTREITARLPVSLVDEFKAMPGITAENLRVALWLYVLVISGGTSWVYRGGIPKLRARTQEFVIERRESLAMLGCRASKELYESWSSLPGISSHNIERAVRLYMLALKGQSYG